LEQDFTVVPTEVVSTSERMDHQNGYLYSYARIAERTELTFGGSYDDFKNDSFARQQFNPKVGLSVALPAGVTLRAATFRTLTRPLLAGQTIEPTQVSGFNQFFDDPEGTRAWRYGVGIDVHIGDSLFVGAESAYRDLSIPLPEASTGRIINQKHYETTLRGYVNWLMNDRIALGIEYLEDKYSHNIAVSEGDFRDYSTREITPSLGFQHPSGVSARVLPRYVCQNGQFDNGSFLNPFSEKFAGSQGFIVADIEFSYRLPRRRGKIALGFQNVLDKRFRFQETLPSQTSELVAPRIARERQVVAQINLVIP